LFSTFSFSLLTSSFILSFLSYRVGLLLFTSTFFSTLFGRYTSRWTERTAVVAVLTFFTGGSAGSFAVVSFTVSLTGSFFGTIIPLPLYVFGTTFFYANPKSGLPDLLSSAR
jgi:hypothetical protein